MTLDSLPIAALRLEDGVVVAVNPAHHALTGLRPEDVLGRTEEQLIVGVMESDIPKVERTRAAVHSGTARSGTIWIRAVSPLGKPRSYRVEWRALETPRTSLVFLLDDDHDSRVKELTDGLARASSGLAVAASEHEVMTRAIDALVGQGFVSSFVLVEPRTGQVRQGPSGTPWMNDELRAVQEALEALHTLPVPLEFLRAANPGFDAGRVAFFQDIDALIEQVFSAEMVDLFRRARLGPHLVEVPLLVEEQVFGVLFVSGEALTPGLAGPLEMFGELLARAIVGVRMRARLLERERLAALGEAAAVMAHEVRNPIAAILNAVTLLGRGAAPAPDLLAMISEESSRLEKIVSDLLTLGRPLAPKLVSSPLADVVRRAWQVLEGREGVLTARLVVDEVPGTPLARIDVALVELACLNVLRNALDASPVGGTVRARIAPGSGGGVLAVFDDEGGGFPAEVAARLFEPFVTTRASGTGVGLAVVRRLVEACGGTVAAGASPSGGARITMEFATGTTIAPPA